MHASVAQLVEQGTENPRVVGSIPTGGTINADLAHLVERNLAKVEVAGSSPVIRSKSNILKRMLLLSKKENLHILLLRRRSQAVRQKSAKLLFPGPIPGGASMYKPLKRYLRQKARFYKEFRAFFMPQKVSKQKDIFSRFRPTARNRTGGTLF